jgi:ribulose 1,5-bisphosphate synthetase/thiazole synthase
MIKGNKEVKCISRRDFLGGVVGGTVATILATACEGGAQGTGDTQVKVQFPASNLPILREAEVVIAGGSFAAVAAAFEFAKAGKKVVLVEPRTYLGREITATLRPWIDLGKLAGQDQLPQPVRACLDSVQVQQVSGEAALKMDSVKIALEDLLLNAGVELLYASQPIGVVVEEGRIAGLIIGNKSGRQVIAGKVFIDATETATVARIAGAEFQEPSSDMFRFRRTIEFDGAEPIYKTSLSVPADLGFVGNEVGLHRGYRGTGHIFIDCPMLLQSGNIDMAGLMAREIKARHRCMRLVRHLVNNVPNFKNAYMAATSYELHGKHTTCMADAVPEWALEFDSGSFSLTGKNLNPISLSTASFASPLPALWCLQEAARLETSQLEMFADPVSAALVGASFAKSMLAHWEKIDSVKLKGSSQTSSDCSQRWSGAMEARHPASPQRGRWYELHQVPSSEVPVIREADVLVVGGGTSGATAAITSAKEGLRTVLLELNPGLGGTGTLGGVNSYWFGRHVGFCTQVKQLVANVQDKIKQGDNLRNVEGKKSDHEEVTRTALYGEPWNIEAKMYALLSEAERAGVEVFFNVAAIAAVVEDNRIRGVVAAGRFGAFAVLAKVVIDATGDGDIAAFAGAEYQYGSERDHAVMWYSLAQFTRPGRTQNNFTSMVDVSNIEDYTRAVIVGRRRAADVCHDHGIYIASRETRRIRGGAVLTLTDQLRRRQWHDVVNIHYSNCDVKGRAESDWFNIGLVPPHMEIEIPYRALLPNGLENILIAGKAISTTHIGLPAVRMQADLENLGGVVALAAAQAVKGGVPPRQINLTKLQQRLVKIGILPKQILKRKIKPTSYTDAEIETLVGSLDAEKPLYAYSDMEMGEVFSEKIPIVEVCTAGCCRVVGDLEQAFSQVEDKRRILLAQVLAMCDNPAGVPDLIAEIERQLSGQTLPPRTSRIRHAGLPPDQGAMPDVVYLLYSLGMTRDKRSLAVWEKVAELLCPAEQDFRDRLKGTFYYVDAVCYGAELLGKPEAIPILQKLHSYAPLQNLVVVDRFDPDFIHERQAMLELAIGRSLARCGSSEGLKILISYLQDNRAILAEGAHSELAAITGCDYGKDREAWNNWLSFARAAIKPRPMLERPSG